MEVVWFYTPILVLVISHYASAVNVTDHYRPNVNVIVGSVASAEGSRLKLKCSKNTSLPVSYQWKRDGHVVLNHSREELEFQAVQRSEAGVYSCVTRLNESSVEKSDQLTITVRYMDDPVISFVPNVAYAGDRIQMYCNVSDANPGIERYRFFREDTLIYTADGSSTQTLSFLLMHKHELGNYSCTAMNEWMSKSSEKRNLVVHILKPILNILPGPSTVAGSKITLSCVASLDQLIQFKSSSGSLTSGKLTHTSVYTFVATVLDNGVYFYCIASNSFGEIQSDPVSLTVSYTPRDKDDGDDAPKVEDDGIGSGVIGAIAAAAFLLVLLAATVLIILYRRHQRNKQDRARNSRRGLTTTAFVNNGFMTGLGSSDQGVSTNIPSSSGIGSTNPGYVEIGEVEASKRFNCNYKVMFLDGERQVTSLISMGARTEHTVNEFWQRVLENRCTAIVLLAPPQQEVVHQYWPGAWRTLHVRDFEINATPSMERHIKFGSVHNLTVKNVRSNRTEVDIRHYEYTIWNKDGWPSPAKIVELVLAVINQGNDLTALVCSVGTDWAALFLMILTLIKRYDANPTACNNVEDIVDRVMEEMPYQRFEGLRDACIEGLKFYITFTCDSAPGQTMVDGLPYQF